MRGEYIMGSVLTLGLLHRGTEKLMEMRHISTNIGYMDRLDYVSMLSNETAYCEAVEGLLEVDVFYTVQMHRQLLVEVARVENHLLNVACHAGDLGCLLALLWLFEDRESIFDLLASSSGSRMHASSIVPGGVRGVHTLCTYRELLEIMTTMATRVDLLVSSVMTHRTWSSRLQGVGIIHDTTTSTPCSGILMRSTGIAWDMRVMIPHLLLVPTGQMGDSMDRVVLRTLELLTSTLVVSQCVAVLCSTSSAGGTNSISLHGVLSSFMT